MALLLFIFKLHSFFDSLRHAPSVFALLRVRSETPQPSCIYLENRQEKQEERRKGEQKEGKESREDKLPVSISTKLALSVILESTFLTK